MKVYVENLQSNINTSNSGEGGKPELISEKGKASNEDSMRISKERLDD